jgi:bifunctional oligoribonuclease and PAP phosphatase NrnA
MFNKIRNIIRDGKRFLITTHIDPDGDALGSAFSLYWVLKSFGKDPHVYLRDNVPYRYDFLPAPTDLVHTLPREVFDAVFVLDCGDLFRIGDGFEQIKDMGIVISIDHHETNEAFGFINVVERSASSTAEVLYRLYKSMKIDFSYNVAINVYTAIFTDTGSLRYDNADPAAFLICEKMVEAGVKPSYVAQMVYESHPKERFLLLGEVFGTLQTFDQNRIAMAHVTEEMFRRTGTTSEHTDGFSEEFRKIRGVEVSVFIRQTGERRYKISMRSKGVVDVALVCSRFGGGGHKNASGCTIDGDLVDVEEQLKRAFNIV